MKRLMIFNPITYEWGDMREQDFDSPEEWQFYNWLKEAETARLICDIKYHPSPFVLSDRQAVMIEKQLKTKTKKVEKFLFHPHLFTPDFIFTILYSGLYPFFTPEDAKNSNKVFVDVKGRFSKFGDSKQFSINQKWTWRKYNVYVNKIVPYKLFLESFVPEVCRWTPKQLKPVKKYVGCKTIKQFIPF